MRIAYLFNSSMPSANPGSIQVANTCDAIVDLSNDVRVILPNTGLKVSILKYYNLKNELKITRLKYFDKFPLGFNYYLFSLFSVFYGIIKRYDLFITRNFFSFYILNLLKKKVIFEIHHDLSTEGRIVRFLFNNFNIFNSKNVVKIVAITKPVKNYLIKEFKVDKKKIEIIPSASSLKIKFKKIFNKKSYNIGYFGSLDISKGSEFIIKLSKIDKKNKYFIYGGSSKDSEILKKKSNSSNLRINKAIRYSQVKYFISKMDILLMPADKNLLRSLGGVGNIAKYTSPLKLFDYLASGKLIFASNLNVFKEVIKHNKNCIVIDNLNPLEWLNVINRNTKNLKKANFLKKNAFELSKKYTYHKRAEKVLKL